MIFPTSVGRDREAWRWSWGFYAEAAGHGPLTPGEARKMTGKAAELGALLARQPLDVDFFMHMEEDLLADGLLDPENRAWICSILRQVPLLISQEDLRRLVAEGRDWYIAQLVDVSRLDPQAAEHKVDAALASFFEGWRNPFLRRPRPSERHVESGVPLRAMVAYLSGRRPRTST